MDPVDVVVIGGGIGGVSLAAELATDHKVVLVEQEANLGVHATGRSAACSSTTYGNPTVRAFTRASWPDFQAFHAEADQRPVMMERPLLWVAGDSGRSDLQGLLRMGGLTELDVESALELCPALDPAWLRAAALDPLAFDIDVLALHGRYLDRLERLGGVVRRHEPAIAITRSEGVWTVSTTSTTYSAPLIVNAAGAWADEVARHAGVAPAGLRSFRRTMCTSPARWRGDISRWPFVVDVGDPSHIVGTFHFRPEGVDEILLPPCDEVLMEPGDVAPDESDVQRALETVRSVTRLEVTEVNRAWAGLRSFTPDRVPVIGERDRDPGFFWFAGQGFGIMMGPALARYAAALIRGAGIPDDLQALGVKPGQLSPERLAG